MGESAALDGHGDWSFLNENSTRPCSEGRGKCRGSHGIE